MRIETLVSKPIDDLFGRGAFIIDVNTGRPTHFFRSGVKASKYWVQHMHRDTSKTIKVRSVCEYLVELGYVRYTVKATPDKVGVLVL
jgi:hypothetical protein